LDFIKLVNTHIITNSSFINEIDKSFTDIYQCLWIALGQWLGMKKPIKQRELHQKNKKKWRRLQHALDL